MSRETDADDLDLLADEDDGDEDEELEDTDEGASEEESKDGVDGEEDDDEGDGDDDGDIDPKLQKALDARFDKLAGAIARGNQAMIDKALDRIEKLNPQRKKQPVEKILEGYAASVGLDPSDLPDTSKCKTAQEAFELIVEAAETKVSSKPMKKQQDKVEEEESATPTKESAVKGSKRREVIAVPRRARKSGGGLSSDALREQFANGEYEGDLQSYIDKMKAMGVDPF